MTNKTALFPKRALVTGGSGSIGAAICRALAATGIHVIIHSHRQAGRVLALIDEIGACGGQASAISFDISDDMQVFDAISSLLKSGPIQILINNAGMHDDSLMAGMNASKWHEVINTNLNGFFRVTQPLILPMVRTRWGRIITIGSIAGLMGNRGQANYAAAKAGLQGASKSLSLELASRGVTVNVVAPGVIDTGMSKSVF